LRANWFLTDDTAARVFAQSLGLEVHGSLGIILCAAAMGHLQRAEAGRALDRLAQSSLWVSARVLAAAQTALEQLYCRNNSVWPKKFLSYRLRSHPLWLQFDEGVLKGSRFQYTQRR